MHKQYEEWLKQQEIYKTLVFQYGDKVLIHEYGAYKYLAVELGYQAWFVRKETKFSSIISNLIYGRLPDIEECQCDGCIRSRENLGGYQPCARSKSLGFPPRKP